MKNCTSFGINISDLWNKKYLEHTMVHNSRDSALQANGFLLRSCANELVEEVGQLLNLIPTFLAKKCKWSKEQERIYP
jgi:hypothetical protein